MFNFSCLPNAPCLVGPWIFSLAGSGCHTGAYVCTSSFLCTLRCSHSGGAHRANDLLGSSFLPQNYAFIPNACSPPNPHCARLSFSSDLPQCAWPLTSNRSWTPSGSSMVPVCDCFVKLLVICTVTQPTQNDSSGELIYL